jgi:ABC-type multidrug transport system ATPase subunit
VTAQARRIAPIFDVSFSVPPGTVFALVGREGSGKTAVVRCALGEIRPGSGSVRVLGVDPRRERRTIRRRVWFDEESGKLSIDSEPATVMLVTGDPRQSTGASRVGFLKDGRLVLDEDLQVLMSRFRRIRYVNEVTETRTDYGNELDLFDAVRVRVRGWGVEAIVSNFSESSFERFRATEGVRDARAEIATLEEIFAAVVGRHRHI